MDIVSTDDRASAQVPHGELQAPDRPSTKGALSPQDVLDRWECLGGKVRQASGSNGSSWSGLCRNHDDRTPSVSFRIVDERTFLIYCHVCSPGNGRQYFDWFLAHIQGQHHATDEQLAKARDLRSKRRSLDWQPSNVEYVYQDADGRPIAKKVRGQEYDPETCEAERSFRWYRNLSYPHGASWQMSYGSNPSSVEIPLYLLPQLLQAIEAGLEVYLTEGESDCEALVALGLTATSVPNGAGGVWQPQWTEQLKGVPKVWKIADNDTPGLEHAEKVRTELTSAGIDVTVLRPPFANDVRDHLEAGRSLAELVEVEPAPIVERSPAAAATPFAEIEREHIQWAWPGFLAFGKLHIIEGDPGAGKSSATLDILARLSGAGVMPDGSACAAPLVSLICTVEDDAADTIRPRLDYAGANLSKVHFVHNGGMDPTFAIPDDLQALESRIRATGARVVVIDPLNGFLSEKIDSYNDQKVRTALTPLAMLAASCHVVMIVIRHWRKGSGSALHRGAGSIGIAGAARFVYTVASDPEDDSRRIFACAKRNIGAVPASLAFHFAKIEHDQDFAKIEWLGACGLTADDLATDQESEVDPIESWLRTLLDGKELRSAEVRSAAKREGYAWRTVERVAGRINVRRLRTGFQGCTKWSLPRPDDINSTVGGEPSSVPVVPKNANDASYAYPGTDGTDGTDGTTGEPESVPLPLPLGLDSSTDAKTQLSDLEREQAWRQAPRICQVCGTDVDVLGWEHPLWTYFCVDHFPEDGESPTEDSHTLSLFESEG